LRYFGGMTEEEIVTALALTVRRDWDVAKSLAVARDESVESV
jgi:hypothetical protein